MCRTAPRRLSQSGGTPVRGCQTPNQGDGRLARCCAPSLRHGPGRRAEAAPSLGRGNPDVRPGLNALTTTIVLRFGTSNPPNQGWGVIPRTRVTWGRRGTVSVVLPSSANRRSTVVADVEAIRASLPASRGTSVFERLVELADRVGCWWCSPAGPRVARRQWATGARRRTGGDVIGSRWPLLCLRRPRPAAARARRPRSRGTGQM
jgi:hypothetical protein